MTGLQIDNFDDLPYYLLFLNNEIQNKTTTTDHRIGTTLPSSTIHGHICIQAKGSINQNWVLIDHQSTVRLICNPELLKNIRRTDQTMHIFCNVGLNTTDIVGDMPGVSGGLVPFRKHVKYPIRVIDT